MEARLRARDQAMETTMFEQIRRTKQETARYAARVKKTNEANSPKPGQYANEFKAFGKSYKINDNGGLEK